MAGWLGARSVWVDGDVYDGCGVAGETRVMVGVISTAPRSTGLSRDLTGTARDPTKSREHRVTPALDPGTGDPA